MKLIPFSRDLCRDLIANGYSYFTIRYEGPRDEYEPRTRRVTYKALRNKTTDHPAIAIAEILNNPANAEDCYVMLAE